MSDPTDRPHILTVNLEDYFQVGAFNRYVQRGQWDRFETRLPVHARQTLDLLDRHDAKATFFVLGWVAEHLPEVVREVAARGHEVASRGYYHRGIRGMTPDEFRDDLGRARRAIEQAAGRKVVGFRVADGWLGPDDLWALDVLAAEGYAYDSSIAPIGRRFAGEPWRRMVHLHRSAAGMIREVPVSAVRAAGLGLPIGGGNWVRQLPPPLMRAAARRWADGPAPLVMYFHTWELDTEQPRLSTAGFLTRVRHYRNLHRMEARLSEYLAAYRFVPAAEWLGVDRPEIARRDAADTPPPTFRPTVATIELGVGPPVTIVIPLYNEEQLVPYLANTLRGVRAAFAGRHELRFVLVDDGSRDGTWAGLTAAFAGAADVTLLRHERNAGVAAAIMTGLRAAETEVVCSMDADCTYDPVELLRMIPLLTDGVDLVTASPYHPAGGVRNVPGWRLLLSRGASFLYRRVMRNKLHTYTSCFRVYRRSAVKDLRLSSGNFLGVVELLGRLDQSGRRVVEHPAVLDVRLLGRSKMKTLRTIGGHLRLMGRLLLGRLFPRRHGLSRSDRDHALTLLFETAQVPCHAALGEPAARPRP
jgi:polysaccharide deacetylase family protein (PEP-CTERM system associated)